jgi:hypothetical protein
VGFARLRAPYSITSSARARSWGGISRPSVFAVLRLITNSLLFAVGSVAHVYAATEAATTMGTAAMETSAPDHGMDCGGNDKTTHTDCVAMCATVVAILSDSIAVPFAVVVKDVVSDPELPPASHMPSLEPHPPKL